MQIREIYTFDYYPYGMLMPGRSYSSTAYKYGFNGKEKDDEVKGEGNSIAFEARIFDSRLGRFMSSDPWTAKYSWQTPYAYHRNSPITFIDWLGLGDKFYDETGKFLYEGKGNNTGLFVISNERYEQLKSAFASNDRKFVSKLKGFSLTAFGSEEDAAKSWAKSGHRETLNDPMHLERAAQIFQAKTSGDASVPNIFLLGNTVVGNKSTDGLVRNQVDPTASNMLLNGKRITDFTYVKQEKVLERDWENTSILKKLFGVGNWKTKEVKYETNVSYWKASAFVHTHPPGRDSERFSLSGGLFGYSGDIGFASSGYNVYLVPTTSSELSYMFQLKAKDVMGLSWNTTYEGERFVETNCKKKIPVGGK